MESQSHTYIAMDLKSFYASVECVDRGLDPLNTNLVVADASRTQKTICLAVSPSLKSYGIPGRARLFEVISKVREVNAMRKVRSPGGRFLGKSTFADELQRHPELEVGFVTATPRMARYLEYSTQIYNIYLKYIAPEDIHVYSVDECFLDVTDYLKLYHMTAEEMVAALMGAVKKETGITATAGVGSNLYLAKIAMDIIAKHTKQCIGTLTESSYRKMLWSHKPLSDFWQIGRRTERKLAQYGMYTMGDIAKMSLNSEDWLYRLFGIDAELLIDHAWGVEPCRMQDIKNYQPTDHSLSNGQVLMRNYAFEEAFVVVKEMADLLALDLMDKKLVTDSVTLRISYDHRFEIADTGGTVKLKKQSNSSGLIIQNVEQLYRTTTDIHTGIRRINLTANRVYPESCLQYDLFTDPVKAEKEQDIQQMVLAIKKRFGKNAICAG